MGISIEIVLLKEMKLLQVGASVRDEGGLTSQFALPNIAPCCAASFKSASIRRYSVFLPGNAQTGEEVGVSETTTPTLPATSLLSEQHWG